ncbi:Hypothetical protein FKW44_006232, partial [Caligus rogercresseyi]
ATMGYWGFKPFANCKNTSKEPLKYHFVPLGPRVPPAVTMGLGKEPLKCHFVHLGPRVPPAVTMGYWGFKPFATCKNT